ncbi:hypothetical protein [Oxynema aestuarii]|jgi:hypothetical protein|uniref:Uncharacterized protein n=1 Tax=Oxynema aestuarii AP17 TaxID=2064643 RepID=A0A6H1TUV6_9CYAN|nr:hypothetical protein [Oxynema aestuarii]QIZ70398.1 hypothetical protein HCG48_07245 [Oxynema aestuarii AP17]
MTRFLLRGDRPIFAKIFATLEPGAIARLDSGSDKLKYQLKHNKIE